MSQEAIDRAVSIATKAALSGNPVSRVIWIPARSATQNPAGAFAVEQYIPRSAGDFPPWEAA